MLRWAPAFVPSPNEKKSFGLKWTSTSRTELSVTWNVSCLPIAVKSQTRYVASPRTTVLESFTSISPYQTFGSSVTVAFGPIVRLAT
jgi:hypothetical protein